MVKIYNFTNTLSRLSSVCYLQNRAARKYRKNVYFLKFYSESVFFTTSNKPQVYTGLNTSQHLVFKYQLKNSMTTDLQVSETPGVADVIQQNTSFHAFLTTPT